MDLKNAEERVKVMFISFLKSKISDIILLLICAAIFIVVFLLSDISITVFLYPISLCLFFVFVIYAFQFIKYFKKCKELNNMLNKIQYEIGTMPESKDYIEEKYQEIIQKLFDENSFEKSEFDRKSTEMVDYYSIWAHQIKTPIAAMRILIQSHQELGDIEGEYLHDMENELFKIEQYVEMVLSYLRINSESSDYVLKKCKIDEIVKQSIRKYSKLFIAKKISLNIEDSDLIVVTDEKWLSFVIEQIISNALKYTSKGSISIYWEKSNLCIKDTGIGISAEDLPRVFEKGFTGYNGRTDRKSTGIGLYLCKQILNKLGHNIYIESVMGKGTVVKIDLTQDDELGIST